MQDVRKQLGTVSPHRTAPEDLALINRLSRRALTGEEVYTFAVRLCDTEVDRDFERFDRQALEKLSELFVGKSGIFDHNWSARGQTARLYKAEVLEEDEPQGDGPAWYLKGYAYMLRSESNRDLIDEIEAGIKKEVSIGCAVARSVCSICGQERCEHVKGRRYEGKLCCFTLQEPTDAYEWSFVAVPAQRRAGVVKGFASHTSLRKAVEQAFPQHLKELEALEKEAKLGRSYLKGLRQELVRTAGLADGELDLATFTGVVEKLEEAELIELTRAYQRRLEKSMPPASQLYGGRDNTPTEVGAYVI